MKTLCLGNNTELTDNQTTEIARNNSEKNNGLLSDLENVLDIESLYLNNGYYHTSVYDISIDRLKCIIKQFDYVVVLDQPIELWSHPDSFYKTIDFALHLKTPVIWQNKRMSENIKYWENLVKTNKSFCIFPFIELLAYDGKTTVCCRSQKEITSLKNLTDFQTNKDYNKIRKSMIDGVELPDHCSSCYKLENNNIRSARQQETVEWAVRLGLANTKDLADIKSPAYIEVRPSNVCNLQCRMCSPEFSNKIEKEYKSIGILDVNKKQTYTGFDIVNFSNLKKLYVAGGEPTAMPEFFGFLKKCIETNNIDFELLVNTNAAKISKKLLDLGSKFSNLQYTISIDGYQSANDYIRWGSKWDAVMENTKNLYSQHKINFNITLSIYGIFNLQNLVQHLEKDFPDCLIHLQYAEFKDDILNPFCFEHSEELKSKIKKLTSSKNYNSNLLFKTFVDDIITKSLTSTVDTKKLEMFFYYNDMLDQSRNSFSKNYIPELEELRNNILLGS